MMVTISFWFLMQLTAKGPGYDAEVLAKFTKKSDCQAAIARGPVVSGELACVHINIKKGNK